MSIADKLKIPVLCPECGEDTEETMARLSQHYQLVCQHCGATIKMTERHIRALRDGLDRIDQVVSRVGRELRQRGDTVTMSDEHMRTLRHGLDEIDEVLWRLRLKYP